MVLLEHLASSGDQPLGEIAAAVGQTRPTAHRILSNLVGLGYVERKDDGVYGLTPKLRRVALGGDDSRFIAAAEKAMFRLRSKTGETVNLGVLQGPTVRYLSTLPSTYPLRRAVTVGESDPFYCTALGRVLASELPLARLVSMLSSVKLVKRSPRTVTDRAKLQQLIRTARTDGFAVEHDQTDIGVSCIAAPIFEHGEIVAAISISGVQARLAEQSTAVLIRQVRDAANHVARELRSADASAIVKR
jgi:DNA-binding IclR family transcriptional regulator